MVDLSRLGGSRAEVCEFFFDRKNSSYGISARCDGDFFQRC